MQTSLILEMVADSFPERTVLGSREAPVTAGELARRVDVASRWIARQHAENVAFIGLNGWVFPTLIFASAKAGCPIVPLNYRLPDADLTSLLARTAPALVVIDDDMTHRIGKAAGITVIKRSEFELLCTDTFGDAAAGDSAPENDIALLLFTSGTTGTPKTAVLRHRHLTSYVISSVEFLGAEENESSLVSVPPYHIAGVSAVLTGLYGGRRIVYLPGFSAEAWIETVNREGVTHAMVVPTMLHRIVEVLKKDKLALPSLRALSYGGGRMPQPVIEDALACLPGVDFVNAYGLTETSSTVSVLSPQDHREALASMDASARRRLSSVGRPLPAIELEIRDPGGDPVGPGIVGEIHVRGDQVAGEYLDRRALSEDGWFATKDSGWLDELGYLFVEGRLDDVIVRGGENISPGEIEDVLRAHEGVADVAVLGLPDSYWGEKVGAVVVSRDPDLRPEDLAAWVKDRLRSTKTPEVWEFRSELPYNETGKLLRRVLKAEFSG